MKRDLRRGSPWPSRVLVGCALLCAGAVALAVEAQGTPLQLKPSGSFDAWQLALRAVIVGAMAIGALVGGLYMWKNWKGGLSLRFTPTEKHPATVEWAKRISPRTTLLVVKWEGRRYLLSEGASQTQVVDSRAIEELAP